MPCIDLWSLTVAVLGRTYLIVLLILCTRRVTTSTTVLEMNYILNVFSWILLILDLVHNVEGLICKVYPPNIWQFQYSMLYHKL